MPFVDFSNVITATRLWYCSLRADIKFSYSTITRDSNRYSVVSALHDHITFFHLSEEPILLIFDIFGDGVGKAYFSILGKMVSTFYLNLKLPKGSKTDFFVLGKTTSAENLIQNFPLQHHAFLYKGLFCERPTRPQTQSLVIQVGNG